MYKKVNYCVDGKCTIKNGEFGKCAHSDVKTFWEKYCENGSQFGDCTSKEANKESEKPNE